MKRIVSMLLAAVMLLSVCGIAFAGVSAAEAPALTAAAFGEKLEAVMSEYDLVVRKEVGETDEMIFPCYEVLRGENGSDDQVLLGMFMFLDESGEYIQEKNFEAIVPAKIAFFSQIEVGELWSNEDTSTEKFNHDILLPMICGMMAVDETMTTEEANEIISISVNSDEDEFVGCMKDGIVYSFMSSQYPVGVFYGLKITLNTAAKAPTLTVSAFGEKLETMLSDYHLHVLSSADAGVAEFPPAYLVCMGEFDSGNYKALGVFFFLDENGEYLTEEKFADAEVVGVQFISGLDADQFWSAESGYNENYTYMVLLPMLCGIQAMDDTLTMDDAWGVVAYSLNSDEQAYAPCVKNGNTYCFFANRDERGNFHGMEFFANTAE